MPESVWNRVRKYLNAHPKTTCRGTQRAFGDENAIFVKRLYYDWKNYVKPLKEFYEVIMRKFKPVEKLSGNDIRKIKKVERILEKEEK